ncbi:hypothetical protein [Ferrimonas pelagia]|uniref:Uncharacterized protein n=1 Tax=Ferrimonas pelagia TaxID=1177826 RepID=A0ABP9EF47_9GAMM
MRISASFHVEPEHKATDLHTVTTLKAWQQGLRQRYNDADQLKTAQSNFHREIYLAGLYLNQLSGDLPRQLADCFSADKVKGETLLHLLAANGVHSGASTEPVSALLCDRQWQQLKAMLAMTPEPAAAAELDTSAIAEQVLAGLPTMLTTPAEPVAALDSADIAEMVIAALPTPEAPAPLELDMDLLCAQFGTQLIEQLSEIQSSAPQFESKADPHALATTVAQQLSAQSEAHGSELLQSQSALQDEIRELRRQLVKQTKLIEQLSSADTITSAAGKSSDLDAKLASAAKVKKKGVW